MNWYSIFYWLTVADNMKSFMIVMLIIFTLVCVIATICYCLSGMEGEKENQAMARKWMWRCYPFAILFWSMFILTPNKQDTLLIIAGGSVGNFVTSDSSSRAIPSDITKFLHIKLNSEINELSDEAKSEIKGSLGVPQSPKEELLDKVKDLTKEELINYLKSDTTHIK